MGAGCDENFCPRPSLLDLPIELVEYILTAYLNTTNVLTLARCNHRTKSLLQHEYIWKYHLERVYSKDWKCTQNITSPTPHPVL
jgi:hypothetical protein